MYNQFIAGLSGQKNTIINYKCFLAVFEKEFGHYEVSVISSDDIMNFLVKVTEGHISSTKKLKYSLLKTFFNFIESSIHAYPVDTYAPGFLPLSGKMSEQFQ